MSILLSTRQKNWLSTPQKEKQVSFQLQKEKQVSFQLQNNSNNKKTQRWQRVETTRITETLAALIRKKKVEKSSDIQPFLFTPEE